jgi:hypothetical protein
LGLFLSLVAAKIQAQDIQWRPAAGPAGAAPQSSLDPGRTPVVTIGRAIPLEAPSTTPAPAGVVGIGRPVPLYGAASPVGTGEARLQAGVRTVGYTDQAGSGGPPVYRAKPEEWVAPTPTGPGEKIGAPPTPVGNGQPNYGYDGVGSQFGIDGCPDLCAPGCGGKSVFACCGLDGCCARPSHFWVSAEYLFWGIKDDHFPPLVTASAADVPMAGIVGTPGTVVALGGNGPFENQGVSGGRLTVGGWLDACRTCGLEASAFWLGTNNNGFLAASSGLPVLARPFLDVSQGAPFANAELVASPGVLAGLVHVSESTSLWGADLNFRRHLCDGAICCWCYKADLLLGIRYIGLDETLGITESLAVQPGASVPRLLIATGPANILVFDQFKTNNQFYGGQIGFDTELDRGRWFVGLNTKLGLGAMHETVNATGLTTISVPAIGVTTTAPGGLLVQPTNFGLASRDRFAFVPEVGLKAGYNLTDRLRVFVSYNFLYLSSVLRPGDQVNPFVNTSQLPTIVGPGTLRGTPQPSVLLKGTDFWAQGVTIGAELRY